VFAFAQKNLLLSKETGGIADGTEVNLYRNEMNTGWQHQKITKNSFLLKGDVEEPFLFLAIGNDNPTCLYRKRRITLRVKRCEPGKASVKVKSHQDFTSFQCLVPMFIN